jgi:hypothetical protein
MMRCRSIPSILEEEHSRTDDNVAHQSITNSINMSLGSPL